MLRPALLIPRVSSYAVLAVALVLLLGWGEAPPSFTVTFRFGNEVIGPEAAMDLVLPNVEPGRAELAGGTRKPASQSAAHGADIWITLADSPASRRLAELARVAATGRPITGICEISVAGQRGGSARRYTVAGCFAKSVDVMGASRRVTLGYGAINVSE